MVFKKDLIEKYNSYCYVVDLGYLHILKRNVDQDGLNFYLNKIINGCSLSSVYCDISSSFEAKSLGYKNLMEVDGKSFLDFVLEELTGIKPSHEKRLFEFENFLKINNRFIYVIQFECEYNGIAKDNLLDRLLIDSSVIDFKNKRNLKYRLLNLLRVRRVFSCPINIESLIDKIEINKSQPKISCDSENNESERFELTDVDFNLTEFDLNSDPLMTQNAVRLYNRMLGYK